MLNGSFNDTILRSGWCGIMKVMQETSAEFQIQAVWCAPRESGGTPAVSVWPKKQEARQRYILTNLPDFVVPLFEGTKLDTWFVIDMAELHRLLFPESAAGSLDDMLPPVRNGISDARRLWNLWLSCRARLDALPPWVLETVAVICQERDEPGLAALFSLESSQREEGGRKWLDSFPATVRKVERPALPPLEDCERLDPALAASFLGPGGALAKRVPDYEPRPGQIQMLKAVADAFNTGRHLVAEAGTGIGKSLAYLLPAALWAKLNDVPVVVSTNTKNLQTQLVEKDLPAVLGMMADFHGGVDDEPLKAAVIKGRGNYLCLRRLAQMMEGGQFELTRPELRLFAQTLCWAGLTPDGDLDALVGGASIDPAFLANITSSSEECAGRSCRHYRRCFVQKARERALRANLVVANHSLVFSELGTDAPVSLPAHAQVIFDEAHNLEEAATSFFTLEFSPGKLNALLKRLALKRGRKNSQGALFLLRRRLEKGAICPREPHHTLLEAALGKALDAVADVRERATTVFERLHPLSGSDGSAMRYAFDPPPAQLEGAPPSPPPPPPNAKWAAVRKAQDAFRASINHLVELLDAVADVIAKSRSEDELDLAAGDTVDLAGARTALVEFRDTADRVLAGDDEAYVHWVQHAYGNAALGEACAAPINVGEFLAANLFAKRKSVILCSATLSVGGRFDYIASRLGLDRIERERLVVCTAPSPFDYVRQCALLLPAFLPEPEAQDRSYVTELADLVVRLADKYGGRTLCLFTSYRMLKECARLCEEALQARGIRLLVHGESGSRNLITRIFRQGDRCVLFGTQSFWEGVDVVGDALSCVVVARLPFAAVGDPVFSARCEQIEKAGKSSFFTLSLPAAVLRLRQGFGRLIRHRNDRGCVVIADTRLVTKGYGRQFLASLPCPLRRCPDREALLSAFDL